MSLLVCAWVHQPWAKQISKHFVGPELWLAIFLIFIISLGIIGIPPVSLALPSLLDFLKLGAMLVTDLEATVEFFELF